MVACATPKASNGLSKTTKSSVSVDVADDVLGTWVQTGVSCQDGDTTSYGKEVVASFKSGMSVAKAVVTSDKVFWDMKDYKDVEDPNDFCQVSVEEKWVTQGSSDLVVSDSEAVVTGNGQVVCDKKYQFATTRKHKYKVTEKNLEITLSASHDALTGVSSSAQPVCKKSAVVLTFQRDEADE